MVDFLSVLTVIGQVISIVILVLLLRRWVLKKKPGKLDAVVDKYGLLLMLVVALVATGGSLYLSEVLYWTPCKLCWLQRIFVYPQAVLLAIAVWKKDKEIAPYIIGLCIFGLFFAIRHYAEQISVTLNPPEVDPNVPCDATGVSCARTYTFRFGYITIPMMAMTALLMNFLTSLHLLKRKKGWFSFLG